MLVRSVMSFSSMIDGQMEPWPVGRVAELPEGVNWLRLGWVVPVEAQPEDVAEQPAVETPAPVAKPAAKPRKPKTPKA
jgi:hypothetical protein